MDDFAWLVSATVPDWSREELRRLEWSPAKQLLRTIRTHQRLVAAGVPRKLLFSWVAAHRYWSAVSGADIPLTVRIGGGLRLPHPNGVVIHPEAVLGPNCQLMQQVTLGAGTRPGLPILEGHVDVGAGARILGGVRIGAHVQIGANAVVLDDVPAGATVVGIPARIVRRRSLPDEA